jgi:hypothetical protein
MREPDCLLEAWNAIASGSVLHDQEEYQNETLCGTAACLAGWAIHFEDVALGGRGIGSGQHVFSLATKLISRLNLQVEAQSACVYDFMCTRYDLDYETCTELFECDATLTEQYSVMVYWYGEANTVRPNNV